MGRAPATWQQRWYAAHLGPAWRPAPDDAVRRRVAGRTVVVTGASSGIGRATAIALGRSGAQVIGIARRSAELCILHEELADTGATSTMITCDLADPAAVAETTARLAEFDIDTVISNAGLSIRRRVAASGERDDLSRSTAVNLLGPARLLGGLLPGLRARGAAQVINIGSVSAVVPTAGWSSYAATKAGFDAWLRSVAAEVAGDGVQVTTIHFPLVSTPMVVPPPRSGWHLSAEQAAQVVLAAMVRRPRLLCPWWARIAATVGVASPRLVERLQRAK